MCLNRARTDLCGGRAVMRVPTAKAARPADRPHQLQRFLGQPVPGAADRRRLRAAARVAPASRRHRLCAGPGLDAARTVAETGRARAGLGAPRGGASARVFSVSTRLPASGAGVRCIARVTLASPYPKTSFPHSRTRENLARKPPPRPLLHTPKFASTTTQPTSRCHDHLRRNLVAPNTTLSAFTNKAG